MSNYAVATPIGRGLPPEFDAPHVDEHPEDLQPATEASYRRPLGVGCAIAVTVVTAAITSYQVGHRQLWQDEYSTWYASTLHSSDFMRLISKVDLYVTPYYLFMHTWIALFGDSPAVLRTPSVIAMSISAGLIVILGQRLFDLGTGVVAGLIFALIPTVSRYAQEARPYGLVTMFAVLATLQLTRAIRTPTWPKWLWYGLAMLAVGYVHMIAITLAVPHFIAVRTAVKRHDVLRLWRWLAAGVAIVVFVIPFALSASQQSEAAAWIKVTPAAIGSFPSDLMGSRTGYETAVNAESAGARIAAVLGVLAVLAAILLWRSGRVRVMMLATWAVLPPLMVLAGGQRLHLFLFRYFLFTLPAWVLLAAAGVTAIVRIALRATGGLGVTLRVVGSIALVAAVGLLALPVQKLFRLDPLEGTYPDYHGVATSIITQERPGDGIAYSGDRVARQAMTYELRNVAKPRDVFLAQTPEQIGSFGGVECNVPASCIGATPRIWLVAHVDSSDPFAGLTPLTAALLKSRFTVQHVQQLIGVRLILLVAKPK